MNELRKPGTINCKKTILLCLVTAFLVVCRLISMWHMPDVFCDEQDILNHMQSILSTGYDTDGNHMPLFPVVGVGRATFPYLYPMMFFLSILGVTAVRARLVQQVLTILSCFFVAYGMKVWTGKKKFFWISLWAGLAIPWGFLQANRIWDPSFTPVYFAIYFLFFVLLMKGRQTKYRTTIYALVAFSALVLLATVYPPVRIPAVAMWIYSLVWAIKEKRVQKGHIIAIFLVSAAVSLPLAINLLDPEFNSRSARLLIFNRDLPIHTQLFIFVRSFVELFNPNFLFITGDDIYRHSLPVFGMLGTISVIPLVVVLRKKQIPSMVKYMFFVILTTYFSVALTYDYQPHGLRSCLVWMPYVIIMTYGWYDFFENKSAKHKRLWCCAIALQFLAYFAAFIVLQ